MSTRSGVEHTVLVATTEPERTDLYAAWLRNRYVVDVVYDAADVLDALTGDVEVAFLDATLIPPETLSSRCAGAGTPSIVFLVDDDLSPSMLAYPIDDYLRTPVSRRDLLDTIDRVGYHDEFGGEQRKWLVKRALLQKLTRDVPVSVLDGSESFRSLSVRVEAIEERLPERPSPWRPADPE